MKPARMHLVPLIPLLAALSAAPAASAAVLTLSDHSSDSTPASVLDARLNFSVSGDTLTLTVFNDTSDPGYFINEVYFNASDDVTGLTLNPPVAGWTLATDDSAAGFGTFDFALLTGNNEAPIAPGGALTFTFDISGSGPFSESDFTTEYSTTPPGPEPMLAAAKFVRGPDDDSAFGATDTPPPIPLPSAAWMATALLAAVGARHARRAAMR